MHKRSTRKITVPHCKMCLAKPASLSPSTPSAIVVGVQMALASASKLHQTTRETPANVREANATKTTTQVPLKTDS